MHLQIKTTMVKLELQLHENIAERYETDLESPGIFGLQLLMSLLRYICTIKHIILFYKLKTFCDLV